MYLPCISWDAKHICRLSHIFRYLLRPEVMVIYTSNIIYGFSTKSHTTRGGGCTQDSKYTSFSNITTNLRRERGGYTPKPRIQHITSNHQRARPPPTSTPHIQHITPNLRRARPPPTTTPQNQHITTNPQNPPYGKTPPLPKLAFRLYVPSTSQSFTTEIPSVVVYYKSRKRELKAKPWGTPKPQEHPE